MHHRKNTHNLRRLMMKDKRQSHALMGRDFLIFLFLVDKAPHLSISIVIWILSSDTETSAATPLGGGARKVLAK